MKSFKQYLTFSSALAVLGLMCFLFGFAPCYGVTNTITTTGYLTVFQATFGHVIDASNNLGVVANGGMIVAFCLSILGIGCAVLKNRYKLLGFLTGANYITVGILILVSKQMILGISQYTTGKIHFGMGHGLYITGWIYAIGILFIIFGSFALIDAIASLGKTKVQEVY